MADKRMTALENIQQDASTFRAMLQRAMGNGGAVRKSVRSELAQTYAANPIADALTALGDRARTAAAARPTNVQPSAGAMQMQAALSAFPKDLPLEADDPATLASDEARARAAAARQMSAAAATKAAQATTAAKTQSAAPQLDPAMALASQDRADVARLTADALNAVFPAPAAPARAPAKAAPAKAAPTRTTATQTARPGPTRAAAKTAGAQQALPTLGDMLAMEYASLPYAAMAKDVKGWPTPTAAKAPSGKDTMAQYLMYLMSDLPADQQLGILQSVLGGGSLLEQLAASQARG